MENPTCPPGPSKGGDPLAPWTQTREDYDFQFGQPRGDLALALDILGDATALLGQHTMYCRTQSKGGPSKIPADLAQVHQRLEAARQLVRGLLVQGRPF